MPRRGRPFRSSRPIHPTTWLCRSAGAFNTALTTDATGSIDVIGELPFEEITSPTIIRIRGELAVGIIPDNSSSLDIAESLDLFLGLIIVEGDDSWSNPLNTQDGLDQPWLWLDYKALALERFGGVPWTSAGATVPGNNFVRHSTGGKQGAYQIPVDVKAMRRVPRGHKLVIAHTTVSRDGTPTAQLRGQVRVLVKGG